MRILLAEDDTLLGEAVRDGLALVDARVDWFRDGGRAADALRSEDYDVAVLDIGLPGQDGLEVLRDCRARGNGVPVLMLTARDALGDRVVGLDSGADDYLVKPFDMEELQARVRALHRRRHGRTSPVIDFGRVRIHPEDRRVLLDGEEVRLTRREYAVLLRLLENPGRVQTQASLEDYLYSWDGDVESNTIQVHIHNIRRKLYRELIRTVRGVGYVAEPVEA